MEWEDSLISRLQWSDTIINRKGKEEIARRIAEKVHEGEVIAAGSGSTVFLALFAIAEKMRSESLHIRVIPASAETAMTCVQLGIPRTTLLEARPDWGFDGADEVDSGCNLLKGRGGALFKEKLLIGSSPLTYILVDRSKLVDHLGIHFPVPVEIFPGALTLVEHQLEQLGAEAITLRPAKGKDGPLYTENGNWIVDVRFNHIEAGLEKQLKAIPGVIESGIFWGYPVKILVAEADQLLADGK